MVDRSVGIDAEVDPAPVFQDPPIGCEPSLALAPRQARGRPGRQGGESDFFEGVGQFAGVTCDSGFLVGRDRGAEDEVQLAVQCGRAVSVGRADGESLAFQADFVLETGRHFFSHVGSDGTVVDGHQDRGPTIAASSAPMARRGP